MLTASFLKTVYGVFEKTFIIATKNILFLSRSKTNPPKKQILLRHEKTDNFR